MPGCNIEVQKPSYCRDCHNNYRRNLRKYKKNQPKDDKTQKEILEFIILQDNALQKMADKYEIKRKVVYDC